MKAAIFISSGLGNAVLLIPLIKKLKNEGRSITGFFTSDYGCYELFENSGLLSESIKIGQRNVEWVKIGIQHNSEFEEIYLDNFASTKRIFLTAKIIGKKIIAQKLPSGLTSLLSHYTHIVDPVIGQHCATQNLRLYDKSFNDSELTEDLISLPAISQNLNNGTLLAIQIGSANDVTSYKNWPISNWISLIKKIVKLKNKSKIILLGDENEKTLSDKIIEDCGNKVINKVGKTSIEDVKAILLNCRYFIGVDSGLMHMAASLSIPTFTLWGPSNETLYGYEKLFPKKHKVIFTDQSCRPCNSWINPNTSRVQNPETCPDKRCMKELSPEFVFENLIAFIQQLET